MASAVASLGVLINDFLEARQEANLLRKVEKYERLQELMVKRLEFFQKYVDQVENNLAIAERVIDKYENKVIPSWEEGVKGLRAEIAKLQEEKAAAEQKLQQIEQQTAPLRLELAKAKDKSEDLQGLYQASLRMAQDIQQSRDAAQEKAAQAQAQVAQLQQELDRQSKSLEAYRAWYAANLSLRCALEMQLLRADPDNPLLHDQDLRDRVRRAGEMAVALLGQDPNADPYDMAREAGLTFDVPGRPSGVQVLSELALTELYMRRLACLNADGDKAWQALHKVQIGHGAMTAARDLLREMEPDSALLQPQTVQQVQDMAMAEFLKHQQQRRQKGLSNHWQRVEVGHQQVIQRTINTPF